MHWVDARVDTCHQDGNTSLEKKIKELCDGKNPNQLLVQNVSKTSPVFGKLKFCFQCAKCFRCPQVKTCHEFKQHELKWKARQYVGESNVYQYCLKPSCKTSDTSRLGPRSVSLSGGQPAGGGHHFRLFSSNSNTSHLFWFWNWNGMTLLFNSISILFNSVSV